MTKIIGKVVRKKGHLVFTDDMTGNKKKIGGDIKLHSVERQPNGEYHMSFSFPAVSGGGKARRVRMTIPIGNIESGAELVRLLRNHGYPVYDLNLCKAVLPDYFNDNVPSKLTIATPKLGWQPKGGYLWPEKRLTVNGVDYRFQRSPEAHLVDLKVSGTLQQWQKHVWEPCLHSHILILSTCAAFAALMRARFTDVSGGGIHIWGDSSSGKTTSILTAIAVTGKPKRKNVYGWDATPTAVEETAIEHNHILLTIDETGVADRSKLAQMMQTVSFRLCDMREKPRSKVWKGQKMALNSSAAGVASTDVLYLSTGELSAKEIGGPTRPLGSAVRLLDLPATRADSVLGIFDTLPPTTDKSLTDKVRAGRLANSIVRQAEKYHGTAGRAFTDYLWKERKTIRKAAKVYGRDFAEKSPPLEQVWLTRARERFELFYAAGLLAIDAGILPCDPGVIETAITTSFNRVVSYALADAPGIQDDVALVKARIKAIQAATSEPGNDELMLSQYGGVIRTVQGHQCVCFKTASLEKMLGTAARELRFAKYLEKRGCLVLRDEEKSKRTVHLTIGNGRSRYKAIILEKFAAL